MLKQSSDATTNYRMVVRWKGRMLKDIRKKDEPFQFGKKILEVHPSSDGGDIKRRLQQMDFLFGRESTATSPSRSRVCNLPVFEKNEFPRVSET